MQHCSAVFRAAWKPFLSIFVPLILLPLPLAANTREAKCGYVVLLMGIFWATELAPIAITSLFPVFLFPLMGVLDVGTTCAAYFKDTNVLFVGGLMFAVAVEESGLHRRMSLKTLTLVGSEPRRLMMGFMIVTAFLSMFMSNTATTAMMLPIAVSVVQEINRPPDSVSVEAFEMEPKSQNEPVAADGIPAHFTPAMTKIARGFMLCICYSATIGGSGTLIGTGTNVVLSGQLDILYGGKTGVTFASWMGFAAPIVVLNLILCWIWLSFLYTQPISTCIRRKKVRSSPDTNVHDLLMTRYKDLGSMRFGEKSLCVFFVLLLLLWLFHDPKFIAGWAALFKEGYTDDVVPVIFICCILALFPSEIPKLRSGSYPPPLLTWKAVQAKLPWNVVFLLGGGFALAKGVDKSGLARYISNQLSSIEFIPHTAFIVVTMTVILCLTEFTSNVVTASIFLPLLASVAKVLNMNPLRLLIPATLAGSFAFMLPVATPPNALAFGYGFLRIRDMVIAGCMLNVICLCTSLLAINTWGHEMFHLGDIPAWANMSHFGGDH